MSPSRSRCLVPFERGSKLCEVCRLAAEVPGLRRCSRLVVESPAMRKLMLRAAPIARSEAPVVIHGESGTGKDVLARAIAANGPRKGKPFLAINTAALPAELLESELFGHARGAFTGATSQKRGIFEAAEGGTLFLDEIAEMPLPLQAKLLRVLQDGEVRRVGETHAFSVDVRIVCATNQDLRARVAERLFREDLYYRLRVFTLVVPALRDRREDILPLAEMFLAEERQPTGRFTDRARRLLAGHAWPGNVRELVNAVKHGAVLAGGVDVDVEHLPEEILSVPVAAPRALGTLAEVERQHVLRALEACGGNQVEAARALGIGRTTLWRKLRAFGIVAGT
jgi:DNA-binding NtrC family response regulator